MANTFKHGLSSTTTSANSTEAMSKAEVLELPVKQPSQSWMQTAPLVIDSLPLYREMLAVLDPDSEYPDWHRIGCAARAAGLSFQDFDDWSRGGNKYSTAACKKLWQSIKAKGGITAATLVHLAREAGYTGPIPTAHGASQEDTAQPFPTGVGATSTTKGAELEKQFNAWPDAPAAHDYLVGKAIPPTGLKVVPPASKMSVLGHAIAGWLAVPCRDLHGTLMTVQYVSPVSGTQKLSAPGETFGNGMFVVGEILPTRPVYVCEGIGQAHACVQSNPESAAVATFGAARTHTVAKALRAWYPAPLLRIVIVADRGQELRAESVAREVSGAWIGMPPDRPTNYDANDYARDAGRLALAALLHDPHVPVQPAKAIALVAGGYPHISQKGEIFARTENVMIALRNRVGSIPHLRFDEATGEVVVGNDVGRPLTDNDYTLWQIAIEREGFKSHIAPHMMRSAVEAVARENTFDSLKAWVDNLKWDGMERVATFAHRYLHVPDTPYATAVSRYLWSALAGRAIEPGCKADYVPVLAGSEGTGKTRAVEALAPEPRFFTSIDLLAKPDDLARKTRGVAVAEWAEMRGAKTRDEEAIKDFVTRREEHHVPKYREHAVRNKRRFIIVGTTNDLGVLPSYGDARRWFPLEITMQIDVEAIENDREQLWAEGVHLFTTGRVHWKEADALARHVRDDFREEDPLRDPVIDWLQHCPYVAHVSTQGNTNGESGFALADLIAAIQAKGFSKPQTNKLTLLLHSLGCERFRTTQKGVKRSLWRKKPQ